MKKMVLATLLAVVMTATSIPAFAAEAPVEEITVEAEEAVEEVEAVACEESEEAEKATAEAESVDVEIVAGDNQGVDDGQKVTLVLGGEGADGENFVIEDDVVEAILGSVDELSFTGGEAGSVVNSENAYSVNATKKPSTKIKNFKSTATYSDELDFSFKINSNISTYLIFAFADKKEKDPTKAVGGVYWHSSPATGTTGTYPVSVKNFAGTLLTNNTYYFRIMGYCPALGTYGSMSNPVKVTVPDAHSFRISKVEAGKYYLSGKTTMYVTFTNNGTKPVTIRGKNRKLEAYSGTTLNYNFKCGNVTVKPGKSKKVKFTTKGAHPILYFNNLKGYFNYRRGNFYLTWASN